MWECVALLQRSLKGPTSASKREWAAPDASAAAEAAGLDAPAEADAAAAPKPLPAPELPGGRPVPDEVAAWLRRAAPLGAAWGMHRFGHANADQLPRTSLWR